MLEIACWVIGFAALCVAAIAFATYKSVVQLSGPLRLEPADEALFPQDFATARSFGEWAERNGFCPSGCYALHLNTTSFIAAWEIAGTCTFFCIYGVGKKYAIDFVTIFEGDRALTTGSTKDAQLFPSRPGSCKQAFPEQDAEELWRRHQQAEQYLNRTFAMRPAAATSPFAELFVTSIERHMAYIRTLPLWPLRAVWWYAFRRTRLSGLTIEQQHQRGHIRIAASNA